MSNSKPSQHILPLTPENIKMEQHIDSFFLKAAIESIPIISSKNFSLWRKHVENMIALTVLSKTFFDQQTTLSKIHNIQLRLVFTSKLDASVHINVLNKYNEDDSKAIWNSIIKYFALTCASNQAIVSNEFLDLSLQINDLNE